MSAFVLLSENQIMHRDIKPSNIMLHQGNIKIGDFGFCKPMEFEDQITQTMVGSPIYMAPEILLNEPYSLKADIWSLGVLLFELCAL